MRNNLQKFTQEIQDSLPNRTNSNTPQASLDYTVCVRSDRIKALWVILIGWTIISSLFGLGFQSFPVFCLCEFSGAPVILLFLGAVRNFRVVWDEDGFTVTSVLGVRRRYTYQDITGMDRIGVEMELQTGDGRRLSLHCSLLNREAFYTAICQHRNDIPKMPERILWMGREKLTASYKNGVLREAMLIPKAGKYRASMQKYRRIAHAIEFFSYSLAAVCLILIFLANKYLWLINEFMIGMLLCLSVYSLVLFIRYPQYYSARPRPNQKMVRLSESCCTYHKWSPMASSCYVAAYISLFSFYPDWPSDVLHLSIFLGLIAGLLFFSIGKWYSREYRIYRIGLVNLFLESLCFGLSCTVFIFLLEPAGMLLRMFLA